MYEIRVSGDMQYSRWMMCFINVIAAAGSKRAKISPVIARRTSAFLQAAHCDLRLRYTHIYVDEYSKTLHIRPAMSRRHKDG